jgi:hypothetical protein
MSNPNKDRQNGGWNTDWRGNFSKSGDPNSSNTNSYVPNRLVSADPIDDGVDCGAYQNATYTNNSKLNCSCPSNKMKKSKPEGILNGQQGFKFWCSSNFN